MQPKIIPEPKHLQLSDGSFKFNPDTVIMLSAKGQPDEYTLAKQLKQKLARFVGIEAVIERHSAPYETENKVFLLVPKRDSEIFNPKALAYPEDISELGEQGYFLKVTPENVVIASPGRDGLFYGAQTLAQIALSTGKNAEIPALEIRDFPDMRYRGIIHDSCRGKVAKVDTLKEIADVLSFYKINMMSLHIEHTYVFKKHPLIGRGCGSLSCEDIMELDEHCRKLNIDLVPTLQSFGHFAHILSFPEYKHLAESDMGWTLSPMKDGTYELLDDMYSEFLPAFTSKFFNICSDETYDLGKGTSKELADKIGVGRVYLNHILRVHNIVKKYGKTMMMWGDIILQHPELIKEIPKDIIMLNWGYEAGHNYATTKQFAETGLRQFVCPGTSSWNVLFPRINNSNTNISSFVKSGVEVGAEGMLNTDWGDGGHYNLLGHSWYGFIYSAEQSWSSGKSSDEEFDRKFSHLFFDDDSGRMSTAIRKLGESSQCHDFPAHNHSPQFFAMYEDMLTGERTHRLKTENVQKMGDLAKEALEILESYESPDPERKLTAREIKFSAKQIIYMSEKVLLSHQLKEWMEKVESKIVDKDEIAKRNAEFQAKIKSLKEKLSPIISEFEELWLTRSRREGIEQNLNRYEGLKKHYDSLLERLE
jgi:hypothetical protein